MNAEREFIDVGALASKIEDSNLGIRDTTVEAGLWVWLRRSESWSKILISLESYLVLAVAITSRRSSGHFVGSFGVIALANNDEREEVDVQSRN